MPIPLEQASSLTQNAARVAIAIGRDDISAELREKAALVLQDFLACYLEAARSSVGDNMLSYGVARRGLCDGGRDGDAAAPSAGVDPLVAGMLGHTLIREDMHVPSGTHPGVVILPAMLALAQREALSGEALTRGIVAGYHLMGSLGAAARSGLKHRHFRPLGISGPFGAAGGAIAATGAGQAVAINALSFAANFACGLNQWPWAGGQEIYVQAGMAARNGLTALELGRAGLRSSPDILEGDDGLFAAMGSSPDAPAVFLKSLGGPASLMQVTHKPVAACNYVQTAAAAALQLVGELGEYGTQAVRKIVISTFTAARTYPGCDYKGPFDYVEQRKMSFQYAVCAALRYRRLDTNSYETPGDAELQRLIALTDVQVDEAYERRVMPAQPGRVELTLDDGLTLQCALSDVPWLDAASVRVRFTAQANTSLGDAGAMRAIEFIDALWEQKDLSVLWRAMDVTRDTKESS